MRVERARHERLAALVGHVDRGGVGLRELDDRARDRVDASASSDRLCAKEREISYSAPQLARRPGARPPAPPRDRRRATSPLVQTRVLHGDSELGGNAAQERALVVG